MNKAVSRVYRTPSDAHQAVKHLQSAGYKAHDIGVLARLEETARSVLGGKEEKVTFSGLDLVVGGCLVPVLSKLAGGESKLSGALVEALGLEAEAAEYYEFVLGAGDVLLSVQAPESNVSEVEGILGKADARPERAGMASPGFYKASRMSATNPVDATMTGDFRKY
ncbi:MAG: hypothetical protein AB1603_02355 [Chloroflexota bacterium]